MQRETDQNENPEKVKRFVDEQTDKRNYEHLTNENDEISEEDISNVKTGVTDPDENISLLNVKPEAQNDDNKEDGDEQAGGEGVQTPWNILGE